MGKYFIDQYSLLHVAVGVIAYFWDISFLLTLIIHTIFEVLENTTTGMMFINKYFAGIWPGGKDFADATINSISDTIMTCAGWVLAYYADKYSTEHHLYFDK
jgi:hypothetical protein